MNFLPDRTRTSIHFRIILFFLISQLLVIAVLVHVAFDVRKAQVKMHDELAQLQEINSLVSRMSEMQKEIQISVMSYLFTRDENSKRYITSNTEELHKLLHTVEDKNLTRRGEELSDIYTETHTGVDKSREELLLSIDRNNPDEIETKFNQWLLTSATKTAALEDLKTYHVKSSERFLIEYEDLLEKLGISIIAVFFVSFGGALFLYKYISESIVKPLSHISEKSLQLSSGNIANFSEVKVNREMWELSHSLNSMALNIRNNYLKLQEEIEEKERVIVRNKELESRKDDFISMASHELKTPITSLKVFVQIIERSSKEKGDEYISKYISAMHRQLDRLSSLVAELLDVTNIRGGKLGLVRLPTDLNELVSDISENVQQITSTHKIEVTGETCPIIYADKDRIGQVLLNILSNAVKYSPIKSVITVKTECQENDVVVSVTDRGIGIAPEFKEKIFERFFRVYDENEKTFPGLGMGLYISYVIVKKHGGKIWVDSEPGKGSTFYFSLPVEDL